MTFSDQVINAVMALTFISWPIAIILLIIMFVIPTDDGKLVNGKYQLLTNHKRNLGISALVFLLFPLFVVLFWSFTSGA